MSTIHHIARASAETGATAPAYRVDLRAGAHGLVADEESVGVRQGRSRRIPPSHGNSSSKSQAATAG
jgi:hypothetical protein